MAKRPSFVTAAALLGIVLPGTITAAAAREAAQPKPMTEINSNTRICVKEPAVTGTILDRVICKTKAQWQAQGIDISKLTASSR